MSVCYLFDFDGTLVDSMPVYISTMLRILDENRIVYGDDLVKTITPLGANGTAEYFIRELGLKMEKTELLMVMKKYLLDAYMNTIPLKSNVLGVLQELKRRGASLNILTAGPHITLDACLKRLQLWDLFDNIWSSDDFGTTKADPAIYAMVAERLGTTVDRVLFLDDNLEADRTAKAAGMMVCGVYDAASENYTEQMKAIDDFFIYDISEILDLPVI